MKTIYTETVYPYTFTLSQYGNSHVVEMAINGKVQNSRQFNPTAYNADTYQPAIECYDKSIQYAKKLQKENLVNNPA